MIDRPENIQALDSYIRAMYESGRKDYDLLQSYSPTQRDRIEVNEST